MRLWVWTIFLCASCSFGVLAQSSSDLPLPRFVSLASDMVNLRSGPGRSYPIEWVYEHRWLPMEITAEFDNWRRVQDWQGVEGWIHQSLLSGRRSFIVPENESQIAVPLRQEPNQDDDVVAFLTPLVVGQVIRCPQSTHENSAWCYVEVSDMRGWVRREEIWGVYNDEAVE